MGRTELREHCAIDGKEDYACWIWQRRTTPQGCAATDREVSMKTLQAKTDVLHEAVAMEHPDWRGGSHGRHLCDCRRCVSPYHVIPGTASDNMVDRVLAGRQNTAVLTPEKVLAIRKDTGTRDELAKRYECSPSTMKKVRCGYTWKFISEADA